MFVINKASGELGKIIPHPLQSKVDRIIYDELGDESQWRNGDSINADAFDLINNKRYISKRLSDRCFVFDIENNQYVFTGIKRVTAKTKKVNPNPTYNLIELRLSHQAEVKAIKEILGEGVVISAKHLEPRDRQKLTRAIRTLKIKYGYEIFSDNLRLIDAWYPVYSTDKTALQSFVSDNLSLLTGSRAIKYLLTEFGEVVGGEINLKPETIGRYISNLRAKGWVIEAVRDEGFKSTYRLISKP